MAVGANYGDFESRIPCNKGFPNCYKMIDRTHLLVELPLEEQSVDYFDYSLNVSISVQVIVDLPCHFLDVCAGCPNSI